MLQKSIGFERKPSNRTYEDTLRCKEESCQRCC